MGQDMNSDRNEAEEPLDMEELDPDTMEYFGHIDHWGRLDYAPGVVKQDTDIDIWLDGIELINADSPIFG